jgi:NAD(P)-dependent dehydrogenase (short-subunit alcohol dehydrogenase family)
MCTAPENVAADPVSLETFRLMSTHFSPLSTGRPGTRAAAQSRRAWASRLGAIILRDSSGLYLWLEALAIQSSAFLVRPKRVPMNAHLSAVVERQGGEETSMFVDGLLAGKKILVTGGGTGLGKAMAERFLSLGAEIAICGRRKGVCDATAEELMKTHGGRVVSYGVDIRDAAAVEAMVEEIFREGPLTGLVNNAAGNFISRTEDLSPRGFDAIANIVMHGTFYVTQAVGKRWIAAKQKGSVVSIAVTWVRNGGPFVVPSAMSKAAIQAMTMSLAQEWGRHGIRLNAIAPGEIPTEGMSKRLMPGAEPGASAARNPMGRVGRMEELQNLATFLMSDGCEWLSGETIVMDGAEAMATGGNFYELRRWSDDQWKAARDAIQALNARDKAARG